jgi:formylglycine-generating enzyme required for sulfatase activity
MLTKKVFAPKKLSWLILFLPLAYALRLPAQAATAKNDKPVTTQVADPYGLIPIQGGSFVMGCTAEQGRDCLYQEKPSFQVNVSDFQLGKYEVTQAQWQQVMEGNPSYFSGCNECPVEQVSWDDIQIFLRKLNAQTGKAYRLPTEAEWEYAARGGNKSAGYKYAGSNTLEDVAWYAGKASSKTHAVGGKQPNELGLYDMSGNVWEWCQDWKGAYTSASQTNPSGPASGAYRVYRGGGWPNTAKHCRVAYREGSTPTLRYLIVGFRLAL